jgi:flagella basal body P-ring formation protein FlgA
MFRTFISTIRLGCSASPCKVFSVWALLFLSFIARSAAADTLQPVVQNALERALGVPGARIEGAVQEKASSQDAGCRFTEAEVPRTFDGSGRVAVRVAGQMPRGDRCEAWIWVRVRVVAPVAVTTRALRAGDPLADAVLFQDRELRAGHPPARIAAGAVAARVLAAGQVVEPAQVSAPTVRPGERLTVVVVSGALMVEQAGRSVPCARGRTCAVLPSGKHVEGDLVDGRLVVVQGP